MKLIYIIDKFYTYKVSIVECGTIFKLFHTSYQFLEIKLLFQAIVSNDRKLQYAENRIVALEAEVETLTKVEKQEADTISVLDKVMEVVQRLVSGSEDNSLTLQEAFQSFQELRVRL